MTSNDNTPSPETRLLLGEGYWTQLEFVALVTNVDPAVLTAYVIGEQSLDLQEELLKKAILNENSAIDRFNPVFLNGGKPIMDTDIIKTEFNWNAKPGECLFQVALRHEESQLERQLRAHMRRKRKDCFVLANLKERLQDIAWAKRDLAARHPRVLDRGAVCALEYVLRKYSPNEWRVCLSLSVSAGAQMPMGGLVLPRAVWCAWWKGSGQELPEDMTKILDNRELGTAGLRRSLQEKEDALSKLMDLLISYIKKDPQRTVKPLYHDGKMNISNLTDQLDDVAEEAGLKKKMKTKDKGKGLTKPLTKAKEDSRYISRDLVRAILKSCKFKIDKEIQRTRAVK